MKKSLSIFLIAAVVLVSGLTLSAQAKPLDDPVPTVTPEPNVKHVHPPHTPGSVSANSGIMSVLPQAGCTNLLADPGFEAYTPNPNWSEYSLNSSANTPLCSVGDCGNTSFAGPRTGSVWGWFGGYPDVTEVAVLSQTVTIPTNTATLQFYLWIGYNSGGGPDDAFYVDVDSTTVFTATALDIGYYSSYTPVAVNVSAFADGGAHDIYFYAVITDQLVGFHLDDTALCSFAASSKIYLPLVTNSYPKSLANGDFESGPTGWAQYSTNGWPAIATSGFAHGGSWEVWLGGDNDENTYIQQSVTLPASTPYLGYWHWIESNETICGYDFAYVRVNGNIVSQYNLCDSTDTGGWAKQTVNLSAYIGRTVLVQIMVQTDESVNSNLFVDDVGLKSSAVWAPETGSLNLSSDPRHSQSRTGEERLPAGPKPERP